MRNDSRRSAKTLLVAVVAMVFACGSAMAGSGSFTVSVRVLAPTPAVAVLDAFPAPLGSMRVTRTRLADTYLCPMSSENAAHALHDSMQQHGYALAGSSADGRTQSWHDAHGRIDVQLDPVLGTQPTTRIVVQADAIS